MTHETFTELLYYIQPIFLVYFSVINLFYGFLIIIGSFKVFRRKSEIQEEDLKNILRSNSLPEITFIVPNYNMAGTSIKCIESLSTVSYRYIKIIVVDDGSTDTSVMDLIEKFDFIPIPKFFENTIETEEIKAIYRSKTHSDITFIEKAHKGKYDAVNAGINACESDLLVVFDSDTFIEDKEFISLIRPLLTDPRTVGVGASIRIMNGCDLNYNRVSTFRFPGSFLTSVQSIEYLRSFACRMGWNYFNSNFIVSGAFSIYPTQLLKDLQGYSSTVGEDAEICVRIHRVMRELKRDYRITYLPDPVAWTIVPETWQQISNQRDRWQIAIMETFWFHKRMFLNPRYGILGLLSFPFFFFAEVIEPIMEILGYTYLFFCWWYSALFLPLLVLYLIITIGFISFVTFFCVLIEELSYNRYPTFKGIFTNLSTNISLVENQGLFPISLPL